MSLFYFKIRHSLFTNTKQYIFNQLKHNFELTVLSRQYNQSDKPPTDACTTYRVFQTKFDNNDIVDIHGSLRRVTVTHLSIVRLFGATRREAKNA